MNASATLDGRIQTLSPHVANQIAAGEVVERPSSVVKELLENSLDAGARRIVLKLRDGGREAIRLIDDGHGMGPQDARAAFEPHATSKLRNAEELSNLVSYGFRGEALASIASVARITLITRSNEAELATELRGGGGQPWTQRTCEGAVGTDLTISQLFFNVPARRAFLRTSSTELGHILRLFDALALARPSLHLELWHNDKKLCDYMPVETLRERTSQVFDREDAVRLHPVLGEGAYGVQGMLSDPKLHRGSHAGLTLLVNGRWVQDKTLRHAVVQAYGDRLGARQYPLGVLHLTCPASTVDVNVHPAKTEVRFVSTLAVHRAVLLAVQAMVDQTPWDGLPGLEEPRGSYLPVSNAPVAPRGPTHQRPESSTYTPSPLRPIHSAKEDVRRAGYARSHGRTQERAEQRAPLGVKREPTVTRDNQPSTEAKALAPTSWLGRLPTGEVMLWTADALVVIAPKPCVAHMLSKYVRGEDSPSLSSRRMMLPKTVAVGPQAAKTWLAQADLLGRLGFSAGAAGDKALWVRAVPRALSDGDVEACVREISAVLLRNEGDEEARLEALCDALTQSLMRTPDSRELQRCIEALVIDTRTSFTGQTRPPGAAVLPLDRLRAVLQGRESITWVER